MLAIAIVAEKLGLSRLKRSITAFTQDLNLRESINTYSKKIKEK